MERNDCFCDRKSRKAIEPQSDSRSRQDSESFQVEEKFLLKNTANLMGRLSKPESLGIAIFLAEDTKYKRLIVFCLRATLVSIENLTGLTHDIT